MITKITNGFWGERLEVNAHRAIFHQWEQLETSGCIENFRIAAGDVEGLRVGWFFADSDAYKWLDAAARIYRSFPDPRLASLMDELIALIARTQQSDGYIFTYNQIHFPGTRWVNLQIEHELYCHGHLIEAAVSHWAATKRNELLDIACRAADRIVADFRGKGPMHTPGHEEIEMALLKLYQVTKNEAYLEMARQFIEQRGRNSFFAFSILRQNRSVAKRREFIEEKKKEYLAAHPDYKPYQLPPGNFAKEPRNAKLRRTLSGLSGEYVQQHAPVRKQTVPVGHSVRFGYFETATAMLARHDETLLPTLKQAWDHMIARRMYVTGGIGSAPSLEGFGNDYELDPEYAYAETCAALASMFWSWEMAQITGEAKYSDLFEWQLYNAAAVGMGIDGTTYLYNNPLLCKGGVTRKPWYAVPCCPSNISRTWADLGSYIYSANQGEVRIHQYISSELHEQSIKLDDGSDVRVGLSMDSGLPYDPLVRIKITDLSSSKRNLTIPFTIQLRQPSWMSGMHVTINGVQEVSYTFTPVDANVITASGIDPRIATFYALHRNWVIGDEIFLQFEVPVLTRHAHPKVKGHQGKVAITCGPLVYCLESVDNPNVDIFNVKLDIASLEPVETRNALGSVLNIHARSRNGKPLTFIPYFLWGNRGPSQMTVWVNE